MRAPAGVCSANRIAVAVVAFAFVVGAAVAMRGYAQGAAVVTTDAVIEQAFTRTIPIVGKLVAKQSGEATARIAGTVAAVRVEVGDRVARGQALAALDAAPLELQLALARARHAEAGARLQTARAQLALAGQELARLSGLTDSAAVSKAAFDDARQRHRIASARVEEAAAAVGSGAAEVDLAKLDLSDADIVAPFDGVVTARLTEVGSYLQRGEAVARLVSDRRLEVEADIPAARLGGLAAGAVVEVRLDNGTSHRATARAVIPLENPRTRTRRVRFNADFGARAGLLASEQSATVLVPAGTKRNIVSVHKDAVVQRGRDKIVFVVVDGAAAIRNIQTGESSGDRLEVLDGLAPGDLAVVRGNERLQPDQPVVGSPLQ